MRLLISELEKLPEQERSEQVANLVRAAKSVARPGQLNADLHALEVRYGMTTSQMRVRFGLGEIEDTDDVSRWLLLARLRDRLR